MICIALTVILPHSNYMLCQDVIWILGHIDSNDSFALHGVIDHNNILLSTYKFSAVLLPQSPVKVPFAVSHW